MAEQESKTEAATPARMTKVQADGDIAVSRELTTLASLATGLAVLGALAPAMAQHLTLVLAGLIRDSARVDTASGIARVLRAAGAASAAIVLPIGAAISVAVLAATFLQSGLRLNGKAVGLHFNRLNPLSGFANLVSARHTFASAQSIVKIACVGVAIYVIVHQKIGALSGEFTVPATTMPAMIGRALFAMLLAGTAAQAMIAAADFAWTRRQFATRNRMSQEEIKDEQRETDGDPAVKGRLRQLRARQAKRNLQRAMARATVVITNPTHYAVALEYNEGQTQAPRVVAKGCDHVAARIREMAADLRIPIVANPPLARALFTLDEDSEITPEHYRAVAEVIAYVWRLAQRTVAANHS
jgi:Flagellar biosynthesis pathway, component FlhB